MIAERLSASLLSFFPISQRAPAYASNWGPASLRVLCQRMPWRGEKRGEENLTNDTPPKRWFWPPPGRLVRFPPTPVSLQYLTCKKAEDLSDQTLFFSFEGPEIFWRARCSVRFLPPYILQSPMSTPKYDVF